MHVPQLEEVPAAMFIESAKDSLQQVGQEQRRDQLRELHEAVGQKPPSFGAGYELGLQVARTIVQLAPDLPGDEHF